MTRVLQKCQYQEPLTYVADVAVEGFICQSIVLVENSVHVDSYLNKAVEELDFDALDSE